MLFDPQNFLQRMKEVITGDEGVLRQVFLTPQSVATTGTRDTAENSVPADVIVIDADAEDAIPSFMVPAEYDETSDHLKVSLLVAHVSGTSIDLGATAVSRGNVSTAVADEADFDAPTATTIDSDPGMFLVEADLSDLGFAAGDMVAVNFAASARTGSGVAHIVGAFVEFRSIITPFDSESR